MRSRYYNPEIKRFINQDILLGSIANSQSLNRYSYVQGNPVSLIDPFGTRPLTAKEQAVHAILGMLGAFPLFGAVPDLLNAFIYIDQGHYGSAVISIACALSTLGDVAFKSAKLADSGSDLAKVISEVRRYAKTIEGLDSVLSGLDNLYTDHIVEGKEISGNTIWNIISITAGLGEVIGVNMSAKQKQALYDAVASAKDGVDKAAKKFVENVTGVADDIPGNNVDDVVEGITSNGTIWDNIISTADNMTGTEIPATFQIKLDDSVNYINPQTGTNILWTNANATEHMGEYISRFGSESNSIGVRSQLMLESYSSALNEAMMDLNRKNPDRYFKIYGNWELGINTKTGVVYHARMLN